MELKKRFPSVDTLNAMGIVYPQYWAQENCLESFPIHLEVLKRFFCETREVAPDGPHGKNTVVPALLNGYDLDAEQSLFKLFMTSNYSKACEPPFELNPLTKIWCVAEANGPLAGRFPTFLKLAHIAVAMVLGSVEDERIFSSLAFLKSNIRNSLDSHLGVVVGLYSQKMFDIDTFPFDEAYDLWMKTPAGGRYGISYDT